MKSNQNLNYAINQDYSLEMLFTVICTVLCYHFLLIFAPKLDDDDDEQPLQCKFSSSFFSILQFNT